MGMVSNEHEYKMMGMAPYASLKAARDTADIFHSGYRMENGIWRRANGLPAATLHTTIGARGLSSSVSTPYAAASSYLPRSSFATGSGTG
jgi:predicted NodU family carbamoyl transferase